MTVLFDDSDCALHKKWVGESKGNKNLERKTSSKENLKKNLYFKNLCIFFKISVVSPYCMSFYYERIFLGLIIEM